MGDRPSRDDAAAPLPRAASKSCADTLLSNDLLEAIPDAIIAVDRSGQILQVNSLTEQIFGYSRTELVGQSIESLVPVRFRRGHRDHREDFARQPISRPMGADLDLYGMRRDGSEFPVEISLNHVAMGNGMLILSAIRDISPRKKIEAALRRANEELDRRVMERTAELEQTTAELRARIVLHEAAEDELRQSEERFRLLVEGVLDYCIVMIDPEGKVVSWNKGAERAFGFTAEEIIGRDLARSYTADDIEAGLPHQEIGLAEADNRLEKECWRVKKDGSRFWASVVMTALRDETRQLRGFSVIVRDMTENYRLQEQLRQAQKLDAIGRLAGGIAHDFNNLLMIIRSNADLLSTEAPDDDRVHKRLDDIVQASDRGVSMVKQLLTFSREQTVSPQLVNLNSVLAEVGRMVPRLIGDNIELVIINDKPLRPVKVDPGQMFQAIINLALNARDAMPQGGRLSIDAETVCLDEYYSRQNPDVTPGEYIMVAVNDTGTGIPQEIQGKMFEPFFTTKPAGKGTGLGLSLVHGMVRQSGGHVSVYSEPGLGTVIKLYFPVVSDQVETKAEPVQEKNAAATVLLAEDEVSLRRIISEMLALRGFVVLEAENGAEALELAKRHNGQIDAVVTDIVMPVMDGLELGKKIEQVCPRARTIYMSGYNDQTESLNALTPNGAPFFRKPFPLKELVQKLDQILAQRREL
jgi:PAS domain S-box-containing protein